MTDRDLPAFDTPHLARAIEALPDAALDRLPFGAIRVDGDGIIRVYSGAERRLSGSGDRARLGLEFFTGVAPCLDNPRFRGRIEKAMAEGRLDLEFGWTGDFADANRSLRVRVQSAAPGGYWICMLRE